MYRLTGDSTRCLNLGSYNYLGFAETTGPCADAAINAIHEYGAGNCSPRRELGTIGLLLGYYWDTIGLLLGYYWRTTCAIHYVVSCMTCCVIGNIHELLFSWNV